MAVITLDRGRGQGYFYLCQNLRLIELIGLTLDSREGHNYLYVCQIFKPY